MSGRHRMEPFPSRFRKLLADARTLDPALVAACNEIGRRIPGSVVAALTLRNQRLAVRAAMAGFDGAIGDAITSSAQTANGPWRIATGRRRIVVSDDVTADPRCSAIRDAALHDGLRSGWFIPIVAPSGQTAGLFVVLLRTAARPSPAQRAILRRIAAHCAVAIQRERLYAENRRAEARLKNLMANVPGIVLQWTVGADGAMALPFVSDSTAAIAGLAAEEIVRRPERALARVPRADRGRLIAALRHSARMLEPVSEDFRLACGARGLRWFRLISRPQRLADGAIASDALCLDIHETRISEETLRRSQSELSERVLELHRTKARLESQSAVLMETARELTEARDSAEQASRAKSEFLSNMSHELRTPLNAIIGFSEIIREQTFGPVGSPKYREYASDIYLSGQHLLELINDILTFAKIEAGEDRLQVETVELHDIAEAAIRMVHERAERAGLRLSLEIPRDLPAVLADRRKIRQVLLNLLSNAIKFTDRGGAVTVTAWCSSAGVVMQVADTGIGIALEDIPKALGLFGQIDSAFNRRHEGTGLGLPLSKALVEMHGGSLDLQSQHGVGTTVTVRLPAERIVRNEPPRAAAGAG